MSADNWTLCPKCGVNEEAEIAKLKKKAEDAYGKVSADEYLQILSELRVPPKRELTLREDFEIGIYHGEFSIGYRASCKQCGFKYDYSFDANPLSK